MEKLLITISTLVIGGFIGYFSSLILERRKNLILFNFKIFELYNRISQEIIGVLTEMTTLSLKPSSHSKEDIANWKHKISELYFKYYNYLPQSVLNEMNCLDSCLSTNGKNVYIIDSRNEHRLINNNDKNEITYFFDDATLVSHDGRMTKLIDDFWGHKHLYKWINTLKKHTIFQNNHGN